MTAEEFGFFRKYLRQFAESLFLQQVTNSPRCSPLRQTAQGCWPAEGGSERPLFHSGSFTNGELGSLKNNLYNQS